VSIAVVWVRAVAVASVPIINSSTKIYDYIITFDDEVHVLIAIIFCDSQLNHFEVGISAWLEAGVGQDSVSAMSLFAICADSGRYVP
jgi:hypothetical protein